MSNNYPPAVDIPVNPKGSDPDDWQGVIVQLSFDDPKSFTDSYGNTKYNWGCTVNGVKHTLFCTQALRDRIAEQGAVKGSQIMIRRVGEATDTVWYAKHVGGPKGTPGANGSQQQAQQQQQQAPPRQQSQQQPQSQQYDSMTYVPLHNLGAIDKMLDDRLTVYMLAHSKVKATAPEDWDEDRIGAVATNLVIGLDWQLKDMTGSREYSRTNNMNILQPASEIKAPMPTEADIKRFHATGVSGYPNNWDEKRPELVAAVIGQRKDGPIVDEEGNPLTSSKHLTRAEMVWITEKIAKRVTDGELPVKDS